MSLIDDNLEEAECMRGTVSWASSYSGLEKCYCAWWAGQLGGWAGGRDRWGGCQVLLLGMEGQECLLQAALREWWLTWFQVSWP